MINRVVIVGRLTKDPVLSNGTSGISICSFAVAINNRSKNSEKPTASYIPCVAFNQSAENMVKFMKKGSIVGVEGRLSQRTFKRKDDTTGSILEVIADSVQFLSPKTSIENVEPDIPPFDDVVEEDNSVSSDSDENKNLDNIDMNIDKIPF